MKTLIKNKSLLAAIIIFVVGMFVYNSYFKLEVIPESDESSATVVGDDLLKIHKELKLVALDRTVFSSLGYLLLTDFSIKVESQPTGRSNPFDIIGRD